MFVGLAYKRLMLVRIPVRRYNTECRNMFISAQGNKRSMSVPTAMT